MIQKGGQASMKCEKCGNEIPAGSEKCPSCGNISDNAAADVKQSKSQPEPEKIAKSNQENTKSEITSQTGKNNSDKSEESVAKEPDADFELRYSSMFDKSNVSTDNEYKIDEELKRKREARYDESFSNMTNDEKIKALEAARLARKEKREKKLAKKESGGFLASLRRDSDKPNAEVGSENRTELSSAANGSTASILRRAPKAAPQAAGDNQPADVSKTVSIDTNEVKKELAKTEKRQRKSRSPRRPSRKFSLTPRFGIILGCLIAVLVVGVVIASVNMASKVAYGEPEMPTVYTKGNTLCEYYDGKEIELSQNFIAKEYEEQVEPTASPKRSSDDDDEAEPTPMPVSDPIKEKDLVHSSSGGEFTYFIDSADMNEKSGSLKFVQNGKKKSLTSIADNVYYNVAVSDDGTGVLYLTGADSFGMGGTLNYWSSLTKKSIKLSDNVNVDNFMFAGGGNSVAYISEYNQEYYVGDLYLASIAKGVVSEPGKIESDVYKVFGTNPAGTTVVYAKNFSDEDNCFEVYMMKQNSNEAVLITDGSRCEPILAKTSDNMFVGGSYADYYQTLYYASLENGQKEKIGMGLTELIEMSKDEQAVVFRKANAEGTAFDYFYANQSGTDEQELAVNVTVLDDEDHKRVCQFDINDDFTKAVYIQGYDLASESGGLYTVSINNGSVSSDKKISDTAYSCNLTPDGNTIRYADNYDITWNLVTLNAYNGEKSTVLAEEVGAGAFTFDKAGEYIVYAKNYSLENRTGDVYCVDNKAKTREVVTGVSTYGLKGNGNIVYSEKVSDAEVDLYFTEPNGKKTKNIDKGISGVVSY